MRLDHLQIVKFRNINDLSLNLKPGVNYFFGENGQGKTNLIESVYLLCRGSSFRTTDSQHLILNDFNPNFKVTSNSNCAKIAGEFYRNNLQFSVEMNFKFGKKSVVVNGKKANSANLMTHFPIVLFSPESLAAIKDGPEQRRMLIDEILLNHDPRHGNLLREFLKCLKSRNRLLKNLQEGIGDSNESQKTLESLNKIFFILATHLSFTRIQALTEILPFMKSALASIFLEKNVDISVDYLISDSSALHWTESEIFDALHKRYLELSDREVSAGVSLVGPQKHDIKFLFSGNDSRFYCSQGQQRALILALKIAQIVYHHGVHKTYPILLLDDVMSELDAKKRINLMKFLEEISAQILITATDLTWSEEFELDKNSLFSVKGGNVSSFHV